MSSSRFIILFMSAPNKCLIIFHDGVQTNVYNAMKDEKNDEKNIDKK